MNRLAVVGVLLLSAGSACGSLDDDRPATLAYVTEAVLAPSCAQAECHSTFSDTYGFAFDTVDAARDSFVRSSFAYSGSAFDGVTADSTPLAKIITVGFPIDSSTPTRMPYDLPLPDYDTYLIKAWIATGLNNDYGPEGAQCIPADGSARGCAVPGGINAGDLVGVVTCDDGNVVGDVITDCSQTNQVCVEGACVAE